MMEIQQKLNRIVILGKTPLFRTEIEKNMNEFLLRNKV